MREVMADRLVAVDPGVVVQIPGLGLSDRGMDQDVGVVLLGRIDHHLPVQPVHHRARVEGDDPPPAELAEHVAEPLPVVPEGLELVMRRELDALQGTREVVRPDPLEEIADSGVGGGGGAIDPFGLPLLVRLPDRGHRQDRGHEPFAVTQGQLGAGLGLLGQRAIDVQGDRDRPDRAVEQTGVIDHRLSGGPVHEAVERCEAAVQEQLQVTDLAPRERERREPQRGRAQAAPRRGPHR